MTVFPEPGKFPHWMDVEAVSRALVAFAIPSQHHRWQDCEMCFAMRRDWEQIATALGTA